MRGVPAKMWLVGFLASLTAALAVTLVRGTNQSPELQEVVV